ncbi:hypothetical protein FXO38_35311 [Capsicum annuum]|uniref:Uncharacterized protein n=1 Tax=Capsicum annuum TaxID=4072 RepID=A0A2G2ZMU0_CAPAN|nr:hypothetical protein FXO38_35311 [Capsicum annuum]KAF3622913.1 hypothetical protein FXO37_32131 [Capsicum annuum]PHT83308.1 hypothetical protein T459_11751 [Capsicum annuum]
MREFEISCQLKRLTGSNIAAIWEGIRKCIFVLLKQVANIFPQLIMTIEKHSFSGKADTGGKKANVVGMNTSVVPKIDVEFWREHKRDLIWNARALGRSRIACDRAKRTLRSTAQTTTESTEPVGKCLNEAKVDNVQIQEVILVSRSTRIPIIQHLLKDYFDEKKLYASINLNDDTACGTAVLDVILIGNGDENIQELLVVDVTLLDLGIETVGGTIMC